MSTTWQWTPDWSQPVLERLEWLTGVLPSRDLTEQAIRLRNYPRRFLEFRVVAHERTRRSMEAALFGKQGEEWLLPIWPDGVFLDTTLPSGTTVISVDTQYMDYHDGGQAVLIGDYISEAVTIGTVSANQITLVAGTVNEFLPGARLYPARTARLQGAQPIKRLTDQLVTTTCRMRVTDNTDHALPSPATYRGLPVLENQPNWSGDLAATYRRQLAVLDYGTSHPYVEDTAGRGEVVQTHKWTFGDRASIDAHRAWLYSLAGRQGAFWLPTWMQDIKVTADIGDIATQIDIEHTGYVDHLAQALNRRDIAIHLNDGTVFRRRIDAAAPVDANTERLTIDAALGQAVSASNIQRTSFLQTARLEADAAEIAWHTGTLAEAAQALRVVNDDA